MMPDAFTMNSGDDSFSACRFPAAIASALAALSRRTNSLNATHSSSFSRMVDGCHTPWPVIEVPVVLRGDIRMSFVFVWTTPVSAAPGVGHTERCLSTHRELPKLWKLRRFDQFLGLLGFGLDFEQR